MSGDGHQPSTDGRAVSDRLAEDPSTFAALAGDFYRGEVDRTTAWRSRLDQTTNWAVVIVAAVLTWAFSSPDRPHYVILIGVFATTAFLVMEANRYREYDIWRDRVRTLQEGLLADLFAPDGGEEVDWRSRLGSGLRSPAFTITFREALTHRLRRSYLGLLLILLAAWVARVALLEPTEPLDETAAILSLPGTAVAAGLAAFYAVVIALSMWSARTGRVQEFAE